MKKKTTKTKSKKVIKRKISKRKITKRKSSKRTNPCGCLHNPEDYGRFGQVEPMTFKDAEELLRINGIKLEKGKPVGYQFRIPGTNISRFSYDLGGIVSEAMNYFGKPTPSQRDFDLSKWKTL